MENNAITFLGNNEQLFCRNKIELPNPKMTIIVPETHNAILIKDGQMLQTLVSGKYVLSQFVDFKTEFDAGLELLFMSKTAKLKLLWGTSQKILMFDAATEENYHLGLSGDFEVQIGDPRKCYLYLVGVSQDLTADALQERLLSTVVSVTEAAVVDYVQAEQVPFNKISVYKKNISQKVLTALGRKLLSEYGIAVFSFNIANIIIDNEEYEKLNKAYKANKHGVEKLTCRNCKTALLANAKFCPNCGKSTSAEAACSKCGTENLSGAKFCTNCGNKL